MARTPADRLVLCYHAVSESWPADLSVTPRAFEDQLDLIVDRGYRGVSFSEAVTGQADGKVVAITFDDAYLSVVEHALPLLSARDLIATVFVATAYPDSDEPMSWPGIEQWLSGEHRGELMPASWDELRALGAAGWEVGSHTHTHPHLPDLSDSALAAELAESKRQCERHLGRPCDSLAYPYGDFDRRTVEAARKSRYLCAGTLPARLARPEPLAWPRIGVYHGDDLRRFKLKVSPALRRARASRAWSLTRLRPRMPRRRRAQGDSGARAA